MLLVGVVLLMYASSSMYAVFNLKSPVRYAILHSANYICFVLLQSTADEAATAGHHVAGSGTRMTHCSLIDHSSNANAMHTSRMIVS